MSGKEWTMTVTPIPRSALQAEGAAQKSPDEIKDGVTDTHTHTTNEWQIGDTKGLRV